MSAFKASWPGADAWRTRVVLPLAGVAALVAIWYRVISAEPLAEVRLRDDAYYYFAWAFHFARGDGPCVTLGEATSGVHWLWSFVLAAVAKLGGHGAAHELAAPARLLGLGLHLTTALVVAAYLPRGFRALGGLVFLGSPFLLHEAQNGQATALAVLTLTALATCAASPRTRGVPFWIVAHLAVLARSDSVLFVMALSWAIHGLRARAFAAPLSAVLVLLAVDLALTGRLVQDSAWPLPWLFWQRFLATSPSTAAWAADLWNQFRPCLLSWPFASAGVVPGALLAWGGLRTLVPRRLRAWPLVVSVVAASSVSSLGACAVPLVAGVLLLFVPRSDAPDASASEARTTLALLGAAFVFTVVHYVVRRNAPPHYFVGFAAFGMLASRALVMAAPGLALAVFAALCAMQVRQAPARAELWPAQREMLAAAELLARAWPATAREPLGAFNSGVLTASRDARVVNLDGLVNASAFAALRRADLEGYLDRERVRLLVDWPAMVAREGSNPHASGRWFGPDFAAERSLLEFARIDDPGHDGGWPGTDAVRVWWRRGHGEAPAPFAEPFLARTRDGSLWLAWPGQRAAALELAPLGSPTLRKSLGTLPAGVATFVRLPVEGTEPVGVYAAGAVEPLLRS